MSANGLTGLSLSGLKSRKSTVMYRCVFVGNRYPWKIAAALRKKLQC